MPQPSRRELTSTGWTALGFVALRPRSGYEIKQAAKQSAEWFWGVSYAQLYPQLRLLHELGHTTADTGTGPRGQTVWRITDQGRTALRNWLTLPPAAPQLRDEALLKLLFVEFLNPEDALPFIERKRAGFQAWIAHFERMDAAVADPARGGRQIIPPRLVREYALAQARAGLAWCALAEESVRGGAGT